MDIRKIKPGLKVYTDEVGDGGRAQGLQIGTVDHTDGSDYIKLKRKDSKDGRHHWIPTSLVDHVTKQGVYLNCNRDELGGQLLDSLPTGEPEQVRTVTAEELLDKMESGDVQVVNVLDPKSYHLGIIRGSLKIPLSELDARAQELDRSREIITYCASNRCDASKRAAETLSDMGFDVLAYEGGIEEWKEKEFPVEAEREAA